MTNTAPPPKRRGRPPIDGADRSLTINVRMSPRQYDDVYRKALRERRSMAAVIRRALDPKSV